MTSLRMPIINYNEYGTAIFPNGIVKVWNDGDAEVVQFNQSSSDRFEKVYDACKQVKVKYGYPFALNEHLVSTIPVVIRDDTDMVIALLQHVDQNDCST